MLTKSLSTINKFPKLSCFFVGLLLKFCFCNGHCLPILLVPVFAVLLYFLRIVPAKREAFFIGYFFGLGYFFSTLYWIAESFKCVGLGDYGYLAVIVLVFYLSIYPALSCLLAKYFSRNQTSLIILFSLFCGISEYVRGILFTGFPWNLIGYATYNIPYFVQVADILGGYGLSLLTILIVTLLTTRKTMKYSLCLFVVAFLYGVWKVHLYNGYIEPKEKILVTLVQPSISQRDKMDVRKFKSNTYRQIGLSLRDRGELKLYGSQNLIVWSEAAVNAPKAYQMKVFQYIASCLCDVETTLITGCDRYDDENNPYNSVYVVGQNGQIKQIYDKRHLLPFGEYIPEFLKLFGIQKITKGVANFQQGSLPRTVTLEHTTPFDIVVCYEIAFPGEIIDSPASTWILNLTNDAWFKNSDGPSQHLKMACFRAIEEGKPIARCANNGISCIIDCNGTIRKKLDTDEIGVISELMPLPACKTVFSSCKNASFFFAIFLLSIIGIILNRTKTYKKKLGREERI